MTPQGVLVELLNRIGAQNGDAILIGASELVQWPAEATKALKASRILTAASPARSAVCPGCERECTMPVEVVTASRGRATAAFIVCDKRSDVNRVALAADALAQWHSSGEAIANFLLQQLEIPGAVSPIVAGSGWRIGVYRSGKNAAQLSLTCGLVLNLEIAGHTIALEEVLIFGQDSIFVNSRRLRAAIDHPVAGGGSAESAAQRAERIEQRILELKAQGVRGFLQTVAKEEGVDVSRIKQIRLRHKESKPEGRAGWLRA